MWRSRGERGRRGEGDFGTVLTLPSFTQTVHSRDRSLPRAALTVGAPWGNSARPILTSPHSERRGEIGGGEGTRRGCGLEYRGETVCIAGKLRQQSSYPPPYLAYLSTSNDLKCLRRGHFQDLVVCTKILHHEEYLTRIRQDIRRQEKCSTKSINQSMKEYATFR